MKLIEPKTEEAPAKWRLKIAKSTLWPGWPIPLDKGGYTVHPVPAPEFTRDERRRRSKAGGNNQKDRLFIRGKDMSGALNIKGRNQLPKPPIKTGMTIKKIIRKAWAVTKTLYTWLSPSTSLVVPSSKRIRPEKAAPISPPQPPNNKYKEPMSLWLVDINHRIILTRDVFKFTV